ncbi:MAG: prepilin-type N-terminal cleavage/methylation domain-containing protein [Candidatus Wallbacteria bacterium]|nr:prepilin-type N-terminal cleavage/methylation domain-containing protein [Candidatus Wallbacteria bacterium]
MSPPRSPGFSLVELAISAALLGILASALPPVSEVASRRRAELELRRTLRSVRSAIDLYVEDRARSEPSKPRPALYPRDLDELVAARYLRRVPKDPMTLNADWRLIGTGDPPDPADLSLALVTQAPAEDARVWPTQHPGPPASAGPRGNLFDLRSSSTGIALDGTRYSEW